MTKLVHLIFLLLLFTAPLAGQELEVVHLTAKEGLSMNGVRSIVKDKYGFLWIGTWNGLCRYDGQQFKTYYNTAGDSTSIPNNRIHQLYKDASENIWISTFNYQIAQYNYELDNFTCYEKRERPDSIKQAIERLKGFDIIRHVPKSILNQVGDFKLSSNGENLVIHNSRIPLIDANINCALYDEKEAILWLGTAFGGVTKVLVKSSPFHPISFHSPHSKATALWSDSTGVWIGTPNAGLICSTKSSTSFKKVIPGDIRAICRDHQGNTWLGTTNRLYRYRQADGRMEKISTEHRCYYTIEKGFQDDLWIGTDQGVLCYDLKNELFDEQKIITLGNVFVTSILPLSKDKIWLATESQGAMAMRWDSIQKVWNKEAHLLHQLPDQRVYSMVKDAREVLWVGTANGLCRVDLASDSLRVIGLKDGLADQYICKLLLDKNKLLWASTKKGISQIIDSLGQINNYVVPHFNYEFVDRSGCVDAETGQLLFGTVGAYVRFSPKDVDENYSWGEIRWTGLEVLNQKVQMGDTINNRVLLRRPIYLTDTLTLAHSDQSFSLRFVMLNYADLPLDAHYAYQLEGVDEDWVSTRKQSISYSNLPAGCYNLKVKATTNNGLHESPARHLTLVVKSSCWEKWWFFLIPILGLLALVGYSFRKKDLEETRQKPELINSSDKEFVQRASEIVLANIANSALDVDFLVEALGMSRTPLYKKLKEITGQTVREFILSIRLKCATELLLTTDDTIAEISYQLGFSSPSNFSRSFQKQFEKTPKRYREENIEKEKANE